MLVYIDDIVVYSKTLEDHLTHLDEVLKVIIKANITLSPPKCHIGYPSLILLGQRVSRLGISTHEERVDAIQAVLPPVKVASLQSFLGMFITFQITFHFAHGLQGHYIHYCKRMKHGFGIVHIKELLICVKKHCHQHQYSDILYPD